MYAAYFGLQHEPFSIAPDPRYLFMSERHREALAHLLYGVKGGGGFVLLTGEIGAGKTTVCRCFLEQVPKRCNVAYIFNPKLDVDELLQTVCQEFHIPDPADGSARPGVKARVDALNDYLLRTHAVGQNNVLIIDEAQNLSTEVLEQLRLLTNLETNERKLLQIILIGQPELRERLAAPELEQLAQRVIARYHLEALSAAETAAYIRHRLQVAGLKGPLPFDRAALQRIHALSRGVPRRINLLCDRALLGAYATERQQVDRDIVDRAAGEVFAATRPSPGSGLAPLPRTLALGGLAAAAIFGVVALAVALDPGPRDSGAATVARSAPAGRAAAVPVAVRASPAASASPGSPPVAPPPLSDWLEAGQSWAGEREAWRALAAHWGVPSGPGLPCGAEADAALQCHRGNGSLGLLRQLDRPAVLTLTGAGRTGHVVLIGLDERRAMLRGPAGTRTVDLQALAGRWQGAFQTLYRRPPEAPAGDVGAPPPAGAWLRAHLDRLQAGRPGEPLAQRVAAFQLAHGLEPDGKPGPETYMQLNRALGVDEPRLQSPR